MANRLVSQSGKKAGWKKDKQIALTSLADFGFFTFADLDYLDKSDTIQASFKNFRNEDIISTGEEFYHIKDDDEFDNVEDASRVRVYINSLDFSDLPTEGSIIHGISFSWKDAENEGGFVTKDENGESITYAIYDVRQMEDAFNVRAYSLNADGQNTGWNGYETNDQLPPEHDHFYPIFPFQWLNPDDGTDAAFLANGWSYTFPTMAYVILKRPLDLTSQDIDLGRAGIEWDESTQINLDFGRNTLKWEIIYPAWTDEEVVINEARFTKLDKQFRWE